MELKLRIAIGCVAQPELHLEPNCRWLFGRSPDCDIVLDDPRVSREHFAIEAEADGALRLVAFASKNPVFLNGEYAEDGELSIGDVLRVGRVTLRVCSGQSAADSTDVRFVQSPVPDGTTRVSINESEDSGSAFGVFPPELAAQRLESTYRLSVTLAASVDVDTLFGEFAHAAVHDVPAERALIALGDPHQDQFEVVKVETRDQESGATSIEMSETVLEEIQLRRTSLLVHNVASALPSTANHSIENLGIESFMCAPMFAQGQFLGLIYLDQSAAASRTFQRHDLVYVQCLARLLALAVDDRLARERIAGERHALSEELRRDELIVATSRFMLEVLAQARRYAAAETGLLIVGEAGTGKRTLGEWIHSKSQRADQSIACLDCGDEDVSIDEELVQVASERLADGGTLLLADVGALSAGDQLWLAEALSDREVTSGSGEVLPLDVRVIATHVPRRPGQGPPEQEIEEDLARHLCGVGSLVLPPVRDRDEDICRLAEFFLPEEMELHPAARRAVRSYSWPGNIPELRAAMEQGVLNAANGSVRLQDLPREVMRVGRREPVTTRVATLQEVELRQIRRALAVFDGNKKRTAEALGISRETLYQKIKAHQL